MTEERIKLKEELIALKQQRTLAERENTNGINMAENSSAIYKRIEEKETEKLQEAKAMLESERQHLREERASIVAMREKYEKDRQLRQDQYEIERRKSQTALEEERRAFKQFCAEKEQELQDAKRAFEKTCEEKQKLIDEAMLSLKEKMLLKSELEAGRAEVERIKVSVPRSTR